ncbi:carbon storage regulator [Pseudomonas sp. RGB]|uniref:carbon storage regulator n=1 Tax=unclassified Pseudomonas TaxID=196821 RepID=UPI001193FE93|nr:carbon storage regulator [Pseudomonas sp. RGB]
MSREDRLLLVITRTPNKRLRIGDEIQINVAKVVEDTVYLALSAPERISIKAVSGIHDDEIPKRPNGAVELA